jgi:hypothetical protein
MIPMMRRQGMIIINQAILVQVVAPPTRINNNETRRHALSSHLVLYLIFSRIEHHHPPS